MKLRNVDNKQCSNGRTAHNRSVCASQPYGGSGYVKMRSGLRPLCIFTPPHFYGCWNASRSFIATAKTSHTAKTSGVIASILFHLLTKKDLL